MPGRGRRSSTGIARLHAEFFGQRLVEVDFAGVGQLFRTAGTESPEILSATDHFHAVRPVLSIRIFHARGQQNRRDERIAVLFIIAGFLEFVGEFFAEEAAGRENFVDTAEPVESERTETAAHRIAHQQRAGQHRRSRRRPQRHGKVHPPVVKEGNED